MILFGTNNSLFDDLFLKYNDNINVVDLDYFKNLTDLDNGYPINILEYLKGNCDNYDIIYIKFDSDLVAFLTAIKLKFGIIYNVADESEDNLNLFNSIACEKVILDESYGLGDYLSNFSWYNVDVNLIPENHKTKTLKDLIDDDSYLTNVDIQDVKLLQNKLKMGVLLQAKSMLNRVLKLTNILDKLYDELLTRIEGNISTTDTASLMYTTDYISKALNDTNQFIMTLVNNEKIQNFFIIDNSTIINTDTRNMDSEKREKLRRAAEIVLNNCEYLVDNKLDKIVNPNEDCEDINNSYEENSTDVNKQE